MGKFTKFHRYAVMEYPVTLKEMEEISKEIPKTEQKFYEFAFKALRKVMKEDENIYAFDMADPKLTKTGFIVVGEHNLYLVAMKGRSFGGAEAEVVKYADIKNVHFDIIPTPFGLTNGGILYLEIKALFGSKKRTIHNIPEQNLDSIVKKIREQVNQHSVKA